MKGRSDEKSIQNNAKDSCALSEIDKNDEQNEQSKTLLKDADDVEHVGSEIETKGFDLLNKKLDEIESTLAANNADG